VVSGAASLATQSGSVLGLTQGGRADLQAASVRVAAAGGSLGLSPSQTLLLNSAQLQASASGGIYLDSQGTVSVVGSGLAASGKGSAILLRSRGELSVAGALSANGGAVTLIGRGGLTQTAGATLATQGGALLLQSLRGSVIQALGASASTAALDAVGGMIDVDAGLGIDLRRLDAGTGVMTLRARAGSVTDADSVGTDDADLIAGSIRIIASEAIGERVQGAGLVSAQGVSANALDLVTTTLSAQAAGNLRLTAKGDVTVRRIDDTLGLQSTDRGQISLAVQGNTLAVAPTARIIAMGRAGVELSATNETGRAVLSIEGQVSAVDGLIRLTADQSVNLVRPADQPLLMTDHVRSLGNVVVNAQSGIRIVDENGQDAAGTFSLGGVVGEGGPGKLIITGNQTIAAGQRLALHAQSVGVNDRLEVSGTLRLLANSAFDLKLASGVVPKLGDRFELLSAGTIDGHFHEGGGLFGFASGSEFLKVFDTPRDATRVIEVRSVERPGAELLSIAAHDEAALTALGSLFNSHYFGWGKSRIAGMTLKASEFLTVDGTFVLSTTPETITTSKGEVVNSARWLIGGHNLNAFVGLGGPYRLDTDHDGNLTEEATNPLAAGFELTGLDVGLALYEEVVAVASGAPRAWLSLSASAKTAEQIGLPLVDIRAGELALQLNIGSDRSVVDHATPLQVPTGATIGSPDAAKTLDFRAVQGTLIRASGHFEIDVGDSFALAGHLGFEKVIREVTLADGTQVRVNTLSFGGEGLRAFAGINGPYWRDLNDDGIYSESEVNPASIGLALNNVSAGLVLASPVRGSAVNPELNWTALKAAAGSVAIVGIPDVTIAARQVAVDLNLVDGVSPTVDADTRVIDFTAGAAPFEVITGTNRRLTLDMPGTSGQLLRVSGTMDVRLGDFFQFAGSVGFERRAQQVTLADGSKAQTELLSLGGTGLSGFVGLGPYGSDVNNNGKFEASEINPNARGLGVRDVEFGLGIFNGKGTYQGTQWLALSGSVGGVDVMQGLPDDLKLQVHDLGLEFNRVRQRSVAASAPGATPQANTQPAPVIDFANRSTASTPDDRRIQITTGTGKSIALSHDGQRGEMVRASGGMQVDLGGFVYVDGMLAVEKSSPTVTLADGTTASTDMLSIGGTNLQVFVGV
ncbi:MAG: hypothetical protein RL458_1632, partial [Pseudomonadota bacterium]